MRFKQIKSTISALLLATVSYGSARAANITLQIEVPAICRMNTESVSAVSGGYSVTFNTFCNANHSASIMLEGMPEGAGFVYNGVGITPENNVLTLYENSGPEISHKTLYIHGVDADHLATLVPQITPIL